MTYKIAVGDKFNHLTVLEVLPKGLRYERRLKCLCDCGQIHYALAAKIYRGLSTRCKRCVSAPVTLPVAERNLRNSERGYVNNARKRDKLWVLSREQFRAFFLADCHYCGLSPAKGIDRVDNLKDYEILNCVPCCKDCNRAKSNMVQEDFNAWIIRLAAKQGFSL